MQTCGKTNKTLSLILPDKCHHKVAIYSQRRSLPPAWFLFHSWVTCRFHGTSQFWLSKNFDNDLYQV